MLFNSIEFIFAFLPITFLGYWLALRHAPFLATTWLAIASLFFYSWWDISSLPILLVSVAFNYSAGSYIGDLRKEKPHISKSILVFSIAINLVALGYYKYFSFLAGEFLTAFDIAIDKPISIALPIGISFFTFTQIAYLVDVYRGVARESRPANYMLFVSYFPHLIAGPILHHKEMMPQFRDINKAIVNRERIADGAGIFLIGLAKKLLIADPLGFYANKFFSGVSAGAPPAFIESLTGSLAYTLQLYFDFSGYSDMAVGVSLIFGIVLPINFNSPYRSMNIIEFWRRWHMTLSRFLRDYLYIALGGNRKGNFQRYTNLLLTMLLGGIWHGAGWTFIAWGALHGVYLIINHGWRFATDRLQVPPKIHSLLSPAYFVVTFTAVLIAWIPFRAASLGDAWIVIKGIFGGNGVALPTQIASLIPNLPKWVHVEGRIPLLADGTIMGFAELSVLLVVSMLIAFLCKNTFEMTRNRRLSIAAIAAPFLIQQVVFGGKVEFLYFQF